MAFKLYKGSKFKKFGSLNLSLLGLKIFGDVPYPILFNNLGVNYSSFGLETANGFQTMGFNEFLSDEFYGVFTDIYLGKVKIHKKYSNPTFTLRNNIGWGQLENQERHQGIAFDTLEEGFFETGISVKNILVSSFTGFGIGVYYRYGSNAFENTADNFVFKFNTSIALN